MSSPPRQLTNPSYRHALGLSHACRPDGRHARILRGQRQRSGNRNHDGQQRRGTICAEYDPPSRWLQALGCPDRSPVIASIDACDTAVSREGTNEDLGLVTALLAVNEDGGDATFRNLRKRRTIVGRAFELLVASTTTSGAPKSGIRRATVGDSTYPLLPSRLQMTQPAASLPTHSPSTTPYTLPPAATPPPNTSILDKHGRGSDISSETGDRGEDGRAAHSHVLGLRTDFDISKQVSRFRVRTVDIKAAQSMYTDGKAYRTCTAMPLTQNSSTWVSRARTQLCHKTTRYYVPGT